MSENIQVTPNTPDFSEQEQIRRDKLQTLMDNGQNPYLITKYDVTHESNQILANYETLEDQTVALAGRMIGRHIMGKASFGRLLDGKGKIQFYVRRDDIGEEAYAAFKKLDLGDLIGFTGKPFKTKTGEISIHVESLTLLSKCLKPLPEKFHGLTDTDLRYRQRYLDMVVNPEVRDTFVKRSQIISAMREFLDARGFLEVETPVLHTQAGGASARPFITHHNTLDIDMYLRIALELHLKRLIVGGFPRVYEIGRVFRNEGMDPKHNPEFTMIELYQAYTDYNGMMDLIEDMIRTVARKVNGTAIIQYGDVTIDFEKPFERISMVEAVKKYAGVDFEQIETLEEARKVADEHHLHYEKRHKKGDILNLFFDEYVEEHLVQPTFLLRGREYDMLMRQLGDAAQWFPCIRVGRPLLSAAEDYLALAAELARRFPREEGPLVLMGHGTEHHANTAYSILEAALCREGQNHILIGTVEGDPSLDTLCRRLLAEGVGRVRLMPLMLVAGDHAVNDMASEASGSWKSRLQAQGIEARCILWGLGSWEFIQKLYAAHALEAASSREGLDIPGKDDKLR